MAPSFIETFKSYVRWVTAISSCLTVNDSCFGKPIVSSSDTEHCVDIVPAAEANSSVVDVSSTEPGDGTPGDFGDNSCSQSLNILIDTSAIEKFKRHLVNL